MSPSVWMVAVESRGGRRHYRTYRLKDKAEADAERNREYAGGWCADRRAAQALAAYLTEREGR